MIYLCTLREDALRASTSVFVIREFFIVAGIYFAQFTSDAKFELMIR
jgi:hypothetical protein